MTVNCVCVSIEKYVGGFVVQTSKGAIVVTTLPEVLGWVEKELSVEVALTPD